MGKSIGKTWVDALGKQDLDVKTARDGLAVKGWSHSGNHAMNWAVSGRFLRGFPLGHMAEISGDSSTGKSFIVTRMLATVQQAGGVALLDDTEGAFNLDWIHNLGVDGDALAYRISRTVDDHLETAQAFIEAFRSLKEGTVGILACDSLAQLSTKHELEVGLDKRDMTKAAELKAFFRIVGGKLIDLPIVYVATNHTIANIGNMYQPRTTPGGGGPKFFASTRIDLRSVSRVKAKGGGYSGVITRGVVQKNRITVPWREFRMAIPFYRAISPYSGLIPVLLDTGILGTSGHYLTYEGTKLSVRAHLSKGSFLKQDDSAEDLMDQIPEILEAADAKYAELESQAPPTSWEEDGGTPPPDKEDEPEEVEE